MSQRPSRPSSPVLPECEPEEDQSRSRMFDQIQREAEEELENAEKVLLAADNVVGETRHPSRASEPRQRSTNKREHQQQSPKPWSRLSSFAPSGSDGQSINEGYSNSGRARPAVLPTNTPSKVSFITGSESRKMSTVPGPRSFPFRTPLNSEVFYVPNIQPDENEADRESAEFEQIPHHLSFASNIDRDRSHRSREPNLKDSKINRGLSYTPSRYGSKPPYSKEKLNKGAFEFDEGDEYLRGKRAGLYSKPSQGNDKFYSTKYTSDYPNCFTRMPSWDTTENEDRYNASKNLGCCPPDNAFADYNFDFGTRARSPPEYLTGGSPDFQEDYEPTPSVSYYHPVRVPYPTNPPSQNGPAPNNQTNPNPRPQNRQMPDDLLAPLQQLSQLTGTVKRSGSSCSRFNTLRSSKGNFDSQQGDPSKGIRQLPKKPDLTKDEINDLIENENLDVNSAFILNSDERKMYKKPCPKQQKAQMNVKQMVTSHKTRTSNNQCDQEKDYFPMEEPDPDDLSPDLAAKMMFSQEVGIHMNSCPSETIKYLFPDNHAKPRVTHKSMVSVVNPSDEVEMLSKTSFVPERGASDSAYSRMKGKGEDMANHRPYDLDAKGGTEKREYVVVAQKPARFNITQFRGNLPSWFPGYFTAFPDQVKGMGIVESPTTAFNRAWATTNPANIPAQDVLILES